MFGKKLSLRWRVTQMQKWREYRKLTQQQVADILNGPPYSGPPYNINRGTTHASIGRYESGKQMPDAAMLEALAKIYNTDVHSLLNRAPGAEAAPGTAGAAGDLLYLWDLAAELDREFIIEAAKRAVKPRSGG